jgi:hypothetical protein
LEHVSQSVAASSSRTTTSKCLMCYIEPIEPSEGKLNTPFSFRMNGVGGPFFLSFLFPRPLDNRKLYNYVAVVKLDPSMASETPYHNVMCCIL